MYTENKKNLVLLRRVDRTYIRAGAAFDAGIGVDYILAIAGGDAGYRTLALASAAADAFVGNLISHFKSTSIICDTEAGQRMSCTDAAVIKPAARPA